MTTTPDPQPAAHGASDAFRADARDAEIARLTALLEAANRRHQMAEDVNAQEAIDGRVKAWKAEAAVRTKERDEARAEVAALSSVVPPDLERAITDLMNAAMAHGQACLLPGGSTSPLGRETEEAMQRCRRAVARAAAASTTDPQPEIASIRTENARHVATWNYIRDRYVLGDDAGGIEGVRDAVDRLARERDEARAECERLAALAASRAQQPEPVALASMREYRATCDAEKQAQQPAPDVEGEIDDIEIQQAKLCYAIEELDCSMKQTECSVVATEIRRALAKLAYGNEWQSRWSPKHGVIPRTEVVNGR